MLIVRSTKCSLLASNESKRAYLKAFLEEYGRVCNCFVDVFFALPKPPEKAELLKPVLAQVQDTWLTERAKKVAAREAIDMINSVRELERGRSKRLEVKRLKNERAKLVRLLRKHDQPIPDYKFVEVKVPDEAIENESLTKPVHAGRSMNVSSTIARLEEAKGAGFDVWLVLESLTTHVRGVKLKLPIKLHKHFKKLAARGKRLASYVITEKAVQFAFEINTGPKRDDGPRIGVDTGMKRALAATSEGDLFGTKIWSKLETIDRKVRGSRGDQRARRALKHYMDETVKEVMKVTPRLVVVETLKGISHKTKVRRRLSRTMRRFVGNWAWKYWLKRLQAACEDGRSAFRSTSPRNTSRTCPVCGFVDERNRTEGAFLCQRCSHADHADTVGGKNVLSFFLAGPYGTSFRDPVDTEAASNLVGVGHG